MKYFNSKQIKILKNYEDHFNTVINAKYKRATSSRINDIVADIYEETTGEILDRNWACAKCTYNIFEKCGKLYYASIKNIKENDGKKKQRNSTRTKANNTKSEPGTGEQ